MSVGNPHVVLNKRIATLEADLKNANQCLAEMTVKWQENYEQANYFYNACLARDRRMSDAIKKLGKYKKERDRALAKNPTSENLVASTIADAAFLIGKAALQGDQHGASTVSRNDQSSAAHGSGDVSAQSEDK